jgi:hypothetical protein
MVWRPIVIDQDKCFDHIQAAMTHLTLTVNLWGATLAMLIGAAFALTKGL